MIDAAPTPIGVFDSGLGGLTVLRALVDALPNQPFVYLGDTAHAPYGDRSPEEIRALTRAAVGRLFAEGCGLAILACNTASAVALRRLQRDWLPTLAGDRRILGVFVPIIEAVAARPWRPAPEDPSPALPPAAAAAPGRRVVFFATAATVATGAFTEQAQRLAPGLAIQEIACPGLVDAIEAGDRARAAQVVARAVETRRPMDDGAVTAVLGCTHYPLVADLFRAALPRDAGLFSQPSVTAASLARYLARHPRFESAVYDAAPRCLTTGDPERFAAAAAAYFGRPTAVARA